MTASATSTPLSRRRFLSLGTTAGGALAMAAGGQSLWRSGVRPATAQDAEPTPTVEVRTSGQGETVLQFVSVVGSESPFGQARLKVIDKFVATHPEVTIQYEAIPYDQFFVQLVTRALAGDAPQIAQDGHHTAQFAVNDVLVAFDDDMTRDSV